MIFLRSVKSHVFKMYSVRIVGRNMLRAFCHPVATWFDMLNVVRSNLTIFKLEPLFKTPNISQHVATGWPNARNMLRPTLLRYVALKMLRSFGRVRMGLTLCDDTEYWSKHIVVEEIWKFVFFAPDLFLSPFMRRFSLIFFYYCMFSTRLRPGKIFQTLEWPTSSVPYMSEEKMFQIAFPVRVVIIHQYLAMQNWPLRYYTY